MIMSDASSDCFYGIILRTRFSELPSNPRCQPAQSAAEEEQRIGLRNFGGAHGRRHRGRVVKDCNSYRVDE